MPEVDASQSGTYNKEHEGQDEGNNLNTIERTLQITDYIPTQTYTMKNIVAFYI